MAILDGTLVSAEIEKQVRSEIGMIKEKTGKVPGLAVLIAGDNAASQIYVRTKDRLAASLGLNSIVVRLDKDVSQAELIAEIDKLNNDDSVDAVLIQLPLPDKFNAWDILDRLDPSKDVDRFHPVNQGMVLLNRTGIFPCTPFGILKIMNYYKLPIEGKKVAVVGRSFIVGKPIANMLTNLNATVTLCHSKTETIEEEIREADIVIAAIGKAGFVTADMVKDGAVLIDVGMNYLNKEEEVLEFCDKDQLEKFKKRGYAVTGDIHPNAFEKASYYTPVPGGIGPMTGIMLMYNTLQLCKQRRKIGEAKNSI